MSAVQFGLTDVTSDTALLRVLSELSRFCQSSPLLWQKPAFIVPGPTI
jgi:hypothetical protein